MSTFFADTATIKVTAGRGGNGAVSFHREKYISAGGPDGGDGGKGGNIFFQADSNLSSLADFRYKRKYIAENGENGGTNNCSGKKGKDLFVFVPTGTLVKEETTGRIIADISDDEPHLICKGGNGGWGNQHFATPTRQIPRFAKQGNPGEEYNVTLELKLLADVGLVGFPNVGKSTLISVVSEAKPKIANYHFTTLNPVLGVVRLEEGTSFVMADIPGLIKGAAQGQGLGHEFLRHVDRCRLLVHVLDISGSEDRDPKKDFETINAELAGFSQELSGREMIVAGNKCDLLDEEKVEEYRQYFESKGYKFFPLMAAINVGTDKLIKAIAEKLSTLPAIKVYEAQPEEEPKIKSREFKITAYDDVFIIEAPWLLKIMDTIDPEDYESLQYFQRVLKTSGIIDGLIKAGVKDGDIVSVYDIEFEYVS